MGNGPVRWYCHAAGLVRMFHVKHSPDPTSDERPVQLRERASEGRPVILQTDPPAEATSNGENRLEMLEFVIVSASRQGF